VTEFLKSDKSDSLAALTLFENGFMLEFKQHINQKLPVRVDPALHTLLLELNRLGKRGRTRKSEFSSWRSFLENRQKKQASDLIKYINFLWINFLLSQTKNKRVSIFHSFRKFNLCRSHFLGADVLKMASE